MGTDGGTMGSPIGSDPWAATATLAIETTDEALDEAGLECVLNGMRRGHAFFIFSYYDPEATFRGLQFTFSGPNYTSWINAGDVTPLPSSFFGTVPSGSINGQNALDFDGATSMATTDDWQDYTSVDAKCVSLVAEVDVTGPAVLVAGWLSWAIVLIDNAGPALTGFSYDGGPGISTPEIPIALGTTYVVELLHADGVMTLRVYDAVTGYRSASVDAPASVVTSGDMVVGDSFNGRIAGLTTFGARGRVPLPADREAVFDALIAQYT
jgi:hypothetical protein